MGLTLDLYRLMESMMRDSYCICCCAATPRTPRAFSGVHCIRT